MAIGKEWQSWKYGDVLVNRRAKDWGRGPYTQVMFLNIIPRKDRPWHGELPWFSGYTLVGDRNAVARKQVGRIDNFMAGEWTRA
jgi:hypothetical protein